MHIRTRRIVPQSTDRRTFLKTCVAAGLSALPLGSAAAAWLHGVTRLLVPFSPGGASDVAARLWAEKAKSALGTVVIENKGGGGGVIGAVEVARSKPDGRTVLFGNTSTQVLIPSIARPPPYDGTRDFAGVYIACLSPTCIVVHESVPVRSLAELIAYAKANPSKLSYGSAGVGTITNLAGELFKQLIGTPEITHVPYKGAAPGIIDLASGQIPMMTPNIGRPLLEFHDAGKVRILAIASQARIKAAPGIPTAIEAGLPGMVATAFNGLFVPAGVQGEIVEELARVTRDVVADRDVQSSLVRSGFDPQLTSGPEAADRLVSEELQKWLPIMKSAGFSMR